MKAYRVAQRNAEGYIMARVPFTASALRGTAGWPNDAGRLSGDDLALWGREESARADFTVWSYGTPIAWHIPDVGWRIVSGRFSVTTSKHQGIVRRGCV